MPVDYPFTDEDLYQIAAMVYGEMGSKDLEHWKVALSAFLNSIGQAEWKNLTPQQILQKRFYAVSRQNDPYKWAVTKQFPNKDEENRFKKILSFVSAAVRGKVDLLPNQFYFTKGEISKLKKNKSFNFDLVVPVGKIGRYYLYKYK